MSHTLKTGDKFKPRPRKSGADTRFNNRIIEVVGNIDLPSDRVLVTSENLDLGLKKSQVISIKRLLSSAYQRVEVESAQPELVKAGG